MATNAELPVVSEPGACATPSARVRPEVLAEFRKHTGSVLSGVFAGSAFDQVALVPVAAAVHRTGRFAANFADRGVRSGFSALPAMWGDPRTSWPKPNGSNNATVTCTAGDAATITTSATAP
ncbi:hypothetical protein [Nocardia beijingensis]|uniref:hypothetical protein n=1 Tax=Nocardia beijingensis TaxID=95162 RepID=UPI003A5D10F9